MNLTISTTFLDEDAYTLVKSILDADIPNVNIQAVISTRELGDNADSDVMLVRFQQEYPNVSLIAYSAKKHGRLKKDSTDDKKNVYDLGILQQLDEKPALNIMVGDMVIKGSTWCEAFPSLNLHPDLPLSQGGKEGMYWEVIDSWIQDKREKIGGMMHLAIPTLDAGTPIAYFQLPARGVINNVDFAPLWDCLPDGKGKLFQELRRAEASFEKELVLKTITAFAEGREFPEGGLDLTAEIVGSHASEGPMKSGRKEDCP